MKVSYINSAQNALLKRVRALQERKYREQERLFVVEGLRAVRELFDKGIAVEHVLVSDSFLRDSGDNIGHLAGTTGLNSCDDQLFKSVSDTKTPAGILAVARMPSHKLTDLLRGEDTLVVVANGIQDPGNLGTMMRTALAAYSSGIILIKGTVDAYNPKVVRAAMGALFALPVIAEMTLQDAVEQLHGHNVRVIGCDAAADKSVFECSMTGPLALVFGNEGSGFAEGELLLMDDVVSIPMNPESESLNVAVSSAVTLFTTVQQRLKGGK